MAVDLSHMAAMPAHFLNAPSSLLHQTCAI